MSSSDRTIAWELGITDELYWLSSATKQADYTLNLARGYVPEPVQKTKSVMPEYRGEDGLDDQVTYRNIDNGFYPSEVE